MATAEQHDRSGSAVVVTPEPVSASPRAAAWPVWSTAACGALVLALLSPIGLASGEAADQMAQALGLRRSVTVANALADVLARFVGILPFGEVGMRPHALALAAGAAALGWVAASLRRRLLPTRHAAVSLALGMGLLTLSRPFLAATTLRPAVAVDFCLLAAGALLLQSLHRTPHRDSFGLVLAVTCGLAAGAGWPVRVALWPPAALLVTWALRRGERWPLMVPTVVVAASGVALAAVVGAPVDVDWTFRQLLREILTPASWTVWDAAEARQMLAWMIDDTGVLGLVAAAVGCAVLVWRTRREAAVLLVPWATAIVAALCTNDVLAARLFTVAALVAPVVAAVDFFADSFGRARVAVVLVMAVILILPPALVGVGAALSVPARRDPAALARRLDTAFAGVTPSPAAAPAPDAEAVRWWRYARIVGLTPPAAYNSQQ